jgi:hypothetical protein
MGGHGEVLGGWMVLCGWSCDHVVAAIANSGAKPSGMLG